MGFFDSVAAHLDDVEAASFDTPVGVFECVVDSISDKVNDEKNTRGLVFTYKITSGTYAGRKINEYKSYYIEGEVSEEKFNNALSWIKGRFVDLGLPKDYRGAIDPESFKGIECVVTTQQRGEYVNVSKVALLTEDTAPSIPEDPWAPSDGKTDTTSLFG